ncbi:MAG: molecular chaperone DnaK [Candidatus Dadabacteria bacterium]|nr:MAG: molecular chaperone DnaK [Candidatus Dadabacteria bacterium]
MGKAIGIDLGTSTSCVAFFDGDSPVVFENEAGEQVIPSVVSFLDEQRVVVGTPAKKRAIEFGPDTVYSAKRLIGRKSFSSEVKKARALMPYEIVDGENDTVRIRIRGTDYAIPEISALVLRELKRIAERQLGEEVTDAVITVPAYFNDGQRQATKDAGTIAGLNVLRILNEPTAAALAYGYGQNRDQRVAVYDLGGGTFDISILEIGGDVYEVIATAGDTYLGGDDFDDRLIDWLAERTVEASGEDPRRDLKALQRLKVVAEESKKRLSSQEKVAVRAPVFDGFELNVEMTRGLVQQLTQDLVQRTFAVVDEALQAARLNVNDLDGVILVGGSTRMPVIREMVEKYFYRAPDASINPVIVVASGAAIQAHSLTSRAAGSLLLDVTSQSLGIGMAGDVTEVLIPRNSQLPCDESRVFTTSKDNQTEVRIRVVQGESRKSSENEILGEFVLENIPPQPRGVPKIEVLFEIDSNGIVHVSAKDQATGQSANVQLSVSGGMSSDEVAAAATSGANIDLEAPAG